MVVSSSKPNTTDLTKRDVQRYYDEQSTVYNFNSKDSFHYGLWYQDTDNSQEAQDNLTKLYGEKLNLNTNDLVLDAGCGIGGPAIYLAENFMAKIEAISISKVQIDIAKQRLSESQAKDQVHFSQQDYNLTSFNDETFTKVYAMESSCHAEDKNVFLKEMYRVLKKGGLMMITDGFLIKRNLNDKETKDVEVSVRGMCLPSLAYFDDFEQELRNVGFKVKEKFNLMKDSEKSIRNAWINAMLAYPITYILSKLGWIPDNFHDTIVMGIAQRRLAKNDIAILGGFVVEK